jgi:hypothetical protein
VAHKIDAFVVYLANVFHGQVSVEGENLALISLDDPYLIEDGKDREGTDKEADDHNDQEKVQGIIILKV